MLVTERNVIMDEVADRLHPRPARRRVAEQPPSLVGQAIGLAVTAAEQKQYDFRRQVPNLVLQGIQIDRVRQPESRIMASVPRLKWPPGATSRLHQLPKLSR